MQLCLISPLCSPNDEHLGTYFVIDFSSAFFSIPLAPAHQDQFSFTWEEKSCAPLGLSRSSKFVMAVDLTRWDSLHNAFLFCYIDDITLTSESQIG